MHTTHTYQKKKQPTQNNNNNNNTTEKLESSWITGQFLCDCIHQDEVNTHNWGSSKVFKRPRREGSECPFRHELGKWSC